MGQPDRTKYSYDPRCLELAEHFLSEGGVKAFDPTRAEELAQWIQHHVELYLSGDKEED